MIKNKKSKAGHHTTATQMYGFNIVKTWESRWFSEGLSILGANNLIAVKDNRLDNLKKRLTISGLTVLELGPLEARTTFLLHSWGAKKVIAVEGRKDNFLKCLVVKNAFKLDRSEFLFGDVNTVLTALNCHFDVCVAVGILYHVSNPVSLLFHIARLCDKLFVLTHYANETYPSGQPVTMHDKGGAYRGKFFYENTNSILGSLEAKVFWLFEEDLLKATKNAGFNSVEIIHKEQHEHGPLLSLWATK